MEGRRTPPRCAPARRAPRLVSVILPVNDGEDHIAAQLSALADQTYEGDWELVVVDNCCRDRTVDIALSFRSVIPGLRVAVAPRRRSLNYARNAGAAAAYGELLAFCDADDVAARDWLTELTHAAPSADIIGGALDLEVLNSRRARAMCPWDAPAELSTSNGFMPYAPGGSCAVWASVARALHWDESFAFGSSDVEFCWRAQLAGYQLAHAPAAVMHVRLKPNLRALGRQYFAYGKSDPQLYRRFQRYGMLDPAVSAPLPSWRRLVPVLGRRVGLADRADAFRHVARKLGRVVGSAQQSLVL